MRLNINLLHFRCIATILVVLGLASVALNGAVQELINPPLEIKQDKTPYNYQSLRGVPIPSGVSGSDGRLSGISDNIGASQNPASDNQFSGFISFGSIVAPENPSAYKANDASGNALNYVKNASNIGLPRGGNIVMSRAIVGAPFLNRPVSFLFGSMIPLPDESEDGKKLDVSITPETYWRREPHLVSGETHVGKGYYFSPHANAIFAIQAGPISITWRKLYPEATTPSDHNVTSKWVLDGGNYYRIFTKRYIVSGSAAKTPQKIYWNTAGFPGPVVKIPAATVPDLAIVYNSAFPATVSPGLPAGNNSYQTDGGDNTNIVITKTLWREGDSLLACNATGRIFVELLGDPRADGQTRQSLGFEIVDVVKYSVPSDLRIQLGDRITPYESPDAIETDELSPLKINRGNDVNSFDLQHGKNAAGNEIYYAVRETLNLNDYQIHWMKKGVGGVYWPKVHSRYELHWPEDPALYSHYARPEVANLEQAEQSAVQLPLDNSPSIVYQDGLDKKRGFLNSKFQYYTYLETNQPQHRALIRYVSGENIEFERVFSWLDTHLESGDLAREQDEDSSQNKLGLVPARHLAIWGSPQLNILNKLYNAEYLDSAGNSSPITTLANGFLTDTLKTAPRVIGGLTAIVGERLVAPGGESESDEVYTYLAGHIISGSGKSYHPTAYIDPLDVGFEAASKGAIIPVNAIPGENKLQVLWFRRNKASRDLGFKSVYWPSVKATYNFEWPSSPSKIVMASNAGSGSLDSLVEDGVIYRQNDPKLVGYNPNEEHALMLGGRAYALRDDLNITSGNDYTSEPYVIIYYLGADGRPSCSLFNVMREDPANGLVFDYIVKAGTMLQAPMPLPRMSQPVTLDAQKQYVTQNTEIQGSAAPANWQKSIKIYDGDLEKNITHFVSHYPKFTYEDRKQNKYVYRGQHDGPPKLEAGTYDDFAETWATSSTVQVNALSNFIWNLHISQTKEMVSLSVASGEELPDWLLIDGLTLKSNFVPASAVSDSPVSVNLVVKSLDDDSPDVDVSLKINVNDPSAGISEISQGPLNLKYNDDQGVEMVLGDRAPYLAEKPSGENCFRMRFYYRNRPDFDWPGHSAPKDESIVPFLLPKSASGFSGNPTLASTPSQPIVYRPVWPADVPEMKLSETLVKPTRGLPDIAGHSSLRVLYQQAMANSIAPSGKVTKTAVKLHDPTRAKLSTVDFELPSSIMTSAYNGKTYFPKLPPHLVERFYFDPSFADPKTDIKGALVFLGEYKVETLGDDYLQLNVLNTIDIKKIKELCSDADKKHANWTAAIDKLKTTLVSFLREENPKGTPTGRWVANEDSAATNSYPNDKTPGTVDVKPYEVAEIFSDDTAFDSLALSAVGGGTGYVTLISNDGNNPDIEGLPIGMHVFKVSDEMVRGEIKIVPAPNPLDEQITFFHSADLAGDFDEYEYEWFLTPDEVGVPNSGDQALDAKWKQLPSAVINQDGIGEHAYTLGGSGIESLSDNYITMRYRAVDSAHPKHNQWSEYMVPVLAEGWIKRVLAGINPFNQRITDLFNNSVDTDVSMLTQAGTRWEGDIALNLNNMNDHGLIEIYETVLNRGKSLSVDSGISDDPANRQLLLAAGYLSDLYNFLGDEAYADASNPTIGISTANKNYGDIATSMFAFKGQVPTLLEEELGLLRGRDDFSLIGVEVKPVYNRMVWNYTRGIDSGEVIYAMNYNIQEYTGGGEHDGVINAEDASKMYPTGHGDAYGHYLTALKNYYHLFMDADFTWEPRPEKVNILGKPVDVDYFDERKFAASASSLSKTGLQIMDLTWRKDYLSGEATGWSHLNKSRANSNRVYQSGDNTVSTVRHWGVDHWANRAGVGTYVNWVVANGMLPAVDPNPENEGIAKIDRTTVSELDHLVVSARSIQDKLDSVEAKMTPLGIAKDAVTFDINPNLILGRPGGDVESHFEQFRGKASAALENAVIAFDEAKDVTRLMRGEEGDLTEFRDMLNREEFAYTTKLIELFGAPYAGDIGPGKTYPQGYQGPDLFNWAWVDHLDAVDGWDAEYGGETYALDSQKLPTEFSKVNLTDFTMLVTSNKTENVAIDVWRLIEDQNKGAKREEYDPDKDLTAEDGLQDHVNTHYVEYTLNELGYPIKPKNITGSRTAIGKLQTLLVNAKRTHYNLSAVLSDMQRARQLMDINLRTFKAISKERKAIRTAKEVNMGFEHLARTIELASTMYGRYADTALELTKDFKDDALEITPEFTIAGLAAGGDFLKPSKAIVAGSFNASIIAMNSVKIVRENLTDLYRKLTDFGIDLRTFHDIDKREADIARMEQVNGLVAQMWELEAVDGDVIMASKDFQDAQDAITLAVWEGLRLLEERELFRKRASAVIQGYRTRDAAFRIFRNERLERYKSLFDLAATYTYLAAKAYDYETGLLGEGDGETFVERIISSRALGVFKNGQPQFAASNDGDPGLSSVLAEMNADWLVLKGRLGINNPDTYGTTVSMRSERYRVFPDQSGDTNWEDVLMRSRVSDLRKDNDIMRYCMQIDNGDGLPVPGIVLEFSTVIADGLNLFGHYLAPGDSTFSSSSFANKIYGVGVAFEGYSGINDPLANSAAVNASGGQSPAGGVSFMDANGLSATPYVYLIPVGVDFMRTPPLGDANTVRSWRVADVSVPLPFNIGASDFSSKVYWQSSDSLSEDLFATRKHQAFRALSSPEAFNKMNVSMDNYTNNRLVGRSVWNSRWKLVIPGRSLLNNPDDGIDRFIRSVNDIKLHFKTYSYSGN